MYDFVTHCLLSNKLRESNLLFCAKARTFLMRKFNSIIFPSTGGIATILNPGITPTAGSYIDEYVSLLSVLEIGDSSGYLKYFQVDVPA